MTSPDEMTRIIADMIVCYPQFTTLAAKRQLTCSIKYQLGYKFFQERKLRFAHEWPIQDDHMIIKYRGRPNFDIIAYNKLTGNIVAMNDCKYSM